jgi:hypothetical protein
MARAKKTEEAGPGHNSNGKLTEEEQSALTVHYELKIIEAQRKVDALPVDVKSARDVVNGHFKRMTADLGFTRKDFEAEVITLGKMTEAEYLSHERKRARLHRLAGRKPGEQLDLVEAIQDTVDEALAAEGDGYRAGRRADDPTPPSTLNTIFHQDWMRGYHAGQEFNGLQLQKAAEILARPKQGELAAAPEDEEGEEDPADPEVIRKKANALKDSGWTEPGEGEADFDQQAAA